MASLIPGYEYDIFISYRHKDNKYDGWVTAFVINLKKELEATFKEDITIYFDENPNDGILDTHDVDESLALKLKSLIFIPILSQTYCDPNSFAWKNELLEFNKMIQADAFGRSVKLPKGNVASRILPVKIHHLEDEDRIRFEEETGGAIRSIEFIYKSAGVNRPLRPAEEHPHENQNHTIYRDQLNKTANALKEIVSGIKTKHKQPRLTIPTEKIQEIIEKPLPAYKFKIFALLGVFILLLTLLFFYSRKPAPTLEPGEIASIAVLPFEDLSTEKNQEYLGDGVAEEILTSLTHVKDLKVIDPMSSFSFKGKNVTRQAIGKILGVKNVLEGTVRKDGNKITVTAKLFNANDGSPYWSETYDRDLKDVFKIQEEITGAIVNKLNVTLMTNAGHNHGRPLNPEAYELLLRGNFYFNKGPAGLPKAVELYNKSIALEPTYAYPYLQLGWSLDQLTIYNFLEPRDGFARARSAIEKTLTLKTSAQLEKSARECLAFINLWEFDWENSLIAYQESLQVDQSHGNFYPFYLAFAEGNTAKAVAMMQNIIERNPVAPAALRNLGMNQYFDRQYGEALKTFDKILEMDSTFGEALRLKSLVLYMQGEYEAAYEICLKAVDQKNSWAAIQLLTILPRVKKQDADIKAVKQRMDSIFSTMKISPLGNAIISIGRNDKDKAFEWLDKAYEHQDFWLASLKVEPLWDPLRADPRFKKLVDRMNFPD